MSPKTYCLSFCTNRKTYLSWNTNQHLRRLMTRFGCCVVFRGHLRSSRTVALIETTSESCNLCTTAMSPSLLSTSFSSGTSLTAPLKVSISLSCNVPCGKKLVPRNSQPKPLLLRHLVFLHFFVSNTLAVADVKTAGNTARYTPARLWLTVVPNQNEKQECLVFCTNPRKARAYWYLYPCIAIFFIVCHTEDPLYPGLFHSR